MNSGVQKTHKIMCMILGLLGAVLIVLSIYSVKESIAIDYDVSIIATQQNAQSHISVEELTSVNTLHIVAKKPLKNASTSVYMIKEFGFTF